jgi:ankyrin repeat protein
MDVLPLPPRPSIEQYRKRAKDLVKAARSGDDDAVRAWAAAWLHALASLGDEPVSDFVQGSIDRAAGDIERRAREQRANGDGELGLSDAQFLIAHAHGFATWSAFSAHLDGLQFSDSAAKEFESAADAVVTGDIETLDRLLDANPSLVHARSPRTHRATLLHYVAANGVEDFRQKSPPNAVAIATRLLTAGAEPDAAAETYGGGPHQTTMNLLVSSVHPDAACVQAALVETLLDFGAAVDGVTNDGSPLMTALAFNYQGAAEALARRGARVDSVLLAAALGRTEMVQAMVLEDGTLRAGVRLDAPPWMHVANDPMAHVKLALVWACRFGRDEVVRLLLERGVDPRSADTDRMTALHWAAASGRVGLVDLLIDRGAELELTNQWGGTVLDSTVYFAVRAPRRGVDYMPVLERLIARGANVKAVEPLPTGNSAIDGLLKRNGVRVP